MSNQGYTTTFILEANRLSSEQVKAGNNSNNALFTNKVSNGIRLNTGDQVSVHSAYISELGAEGSEIEIKGKVIDKLNASVTVSYNNVNHSAGREIDVEELVAPQEFLKRTDLVNNYNLNRRVTQTQSIPFRDDEINLVMNPYKNANGEFYISLPYNYVTPQTDFNSPTYWDGITSGNGYPIAQHPLTQVGDNTYGNITRMPDIRSYNLIDRKTFRPKVNASYNNQIQNDNSRYSIFQMREVIHTYPFASASFTALQTVGLAGIPYDPADTTAPLTNASYEIGTRADHRSNEYYRDIATFPYVRVRNLVTASVNVGYNSTTDVASKLTEDFLRTETIEKRIYDGVEITTTAENQVNKLYKCASPENFQYTNARSFLNWGDGTNASNIYNYISAYETIGVKRPDLYELGREAFPVEGYTINTDFVSRFSNDEGQLVETTIPWTDDNLININKLLKAQQRYPELFAIGNLGGDTTNFVDSATMNINTNQFFLHVNMNASNDGVLGYDLQDVEASYFGSRIGPTASVAPATFSTMPMFFQFNPQNLEKSASEVSGSDYDNAVYGFAIKRTVGSNSYISMLSYNHYDYGTTNASGHDIYPAGVRIGWDWHFTAYGCPCILIYNGFLNKKGFAYELMGIYEYVDVNATNSPEKPLAEVIPEVYLGSPDVEIAFSDETDRFEIRHLHQAEVIGNLYNAGYTAEKTYEIINASTGAVDFTNPDIAIPVNPQANTKCYKINKQPNKNNFTPCMSPYFSQTNASFYTHYTTVNQASFTAQQPFPYVSPNISANTVFDSMCGNYIVDWGMSEKYWDQSLWGIMGFRYQQTQGNGNNQTRIINSTTWSNMDENTTNADITNADFDEVSRNMFNTPIFNITPLNSVRPRFSDTNNASHSFFPDVVITQTTGQPLRAKNIPTRTLRPYYTVRSNIVGQAQYLGGGDSGIPLPVVAIVEKVSQSGDYFNLTQSQLNFTITQPTTLTDITTSIHDPDGSFSSLSPNSAVLYKITKQINADMSVVNTILQGDNKKQALQFEESLDNPEPTKQDINNVINMMVVKPQK